LAIAILICCWHWCWECEWFLCKTDYPY